MTNPARIKPSFPVWINTGSVFSGTEETVSSPTCLRTDCFRASMAQRTASMTWSLPLEMVEESFPGMPHFSLEDPDVRMAAEAEPRGFLARMEGGGVLDEVQRLPLLLSCIQGMVDKPGRRGSFILTGSHQPQLHEAISQSLAGRTAMLALWPFSLREIRRYNPVSDPFDFICRGFFPGLHDERLDPRRFFNGYLQTYVERDVRALIQLRDLSLYQKFLTLLAGRVGQVVNLASLGNDVGASGTTIRSWLSVLKASYVVFELPPYFENIQKRVIKSPKIYFTDVGLAAFLLGIHTKEQASRDPLRGNLFRKPRYRRHHEGSAQ